MITYHFQDCNSELSVFERYSEYKLELELAIDSNKYNLDDYAAWNLNQYYARALNREYEKLLDNLKQQASDRLKEVNQSGVNNAY
jgi:hypothetical protein